MSKTITKNQIIQLEDAQYMLSRAAYDMRGEKVSQDAIYGDIDDALDLLNWVLLAIDDH